MTIAPSPEPLATTRTSPACAAWARESSDWAATCALCASGLEDAYHVLCECTHADVAAVRASVTAALPRKLVWVCRTILAASSTPGQTAAERARRRARDAELVTALGAHLGMTSDGEAVEGAPPRLRRKLKFSFFGLQRGHSLAFCMWRVRRLGGKANLF